MLLLGFMIVLNKANAMFAGRVARMAKVSEEPFFDLGVVKREELDEAPKVEF